MELFPSINKTKIFNKGSEVNNMGLLQIESIVRPDSQISEAYRMLKAEIEISDFDKKIKTIMITSTGFQEGKTYIAANLSVQIAKGGNKTIIVDCHRRKPDIDKIFKLSNERGLSDILLENIKYQDLIQSTSEQNLYALTTGKYTENSVNLFNFIKFEALINYLKEIFDFIILDCPPIMAGADTQIISRNSDGCILVVAARMQDRESISKAKESLEKINSKILGAVLNKAEVNTKSYYKYYKKIEKERNKKHSHSYTWL